MFKLESWLQQRAITNKNDKLWGGSPGRHTLTLLTGLPAFLAPTGTAPPDPVAQTSQSHLCPWVMTLLTPTDRLEVPLPCQGRRIQAGTPGLHGSRSPQVEVSAIVSHCTAPSPPTGGADFLPELGQGGACRLCRGQWLPVSCLWWGPEEVVLGWLGAGNLGKEPGTRTEGPGTYCRDRLSVFLACSWLCPPCSHSC